MRLKRQDSAKQLLLSELEQLRTERARLGEEITALISRRNLLERAVTDLQGNHLSTLRTLEQSHQSRVAEMKSEIDGLEARKREAMRPVDEKRSQLAERESILSRKESELQIREKNNTNYTSLLAEKAQQLADRSSELDEKDARTANREARIIEAERINSISTSDLIEKWQEFRIAEALAAKESLEREKALIEREMTISSDKKWIASMKITVLETERAVASERSAIQHAYDLAKKQGIIPHG